MRSLRSVYFSLLLSGTILATVGHAQNLLEMPNGMPVAGKEPGLLFYLSGDHGFNADYAANGIPAPNFLKDVKILPGGAKGSYLQCGDTQLLSYWAHGNI